jgi:hypothetical protein
MLGLRKQSYVAPNVGPKRTIIFFTVEEISSARNQQASHLKIEAICSSETSVDTRRYILEVDTLHNHHCENLKSYRSYDDQLHGAASLLSTYELFSWLMNYVFSSMLTIYYLFTKALPCNPSRASVIHLTPSHHTSPAFTKIFSASNVTEIGCCLKYVGTGALLANFSALSA